MGPRRDQPAPRKLVCAGCGAAFDCRLGGDCWCAAEPFRLPLPERGSTEDCLCPACLHTKARAAVDPRL
jgi:hypothetical protein